MLNKIMLIGNLGKDPDMSYTQAGTAITKFSLAVNRRSKDRETGERKDETTWFNVTALTGSARPATSSCTKARRYTSKGA